MSTIKKILVPYDENLKSIRALDYAAMFASGIGAGIVVLHLVDRKEYKSKTDFQEDIDEMVTHHLKPKLHEIHVRYPDIIKIDLQIRALEKPIYAHILNFASENEIDFIMMRAHGTSNGTHWETYFKSTTAYKVILEASCPVFTFTESPKNPKIENILVPLDLNDGSLYKVPLAAEFALRFDAQLHLLSASEHIDDKEELEEQLDQVISELHEKNIRTIKNAVRSETLPEAIKNYTANQPIDLVVIMNRPGFRWSDLWVSPRAKRIISESGVPVLSLRSETPLQISI